MPVFPCFDPKTGASGGASGGGGGGADLSGPTIAIDTPEVVNLTDGSWTLYDPDGVVDTSFGDGGVSFDAVSGVTTVRFLGAAGDSKYMIASSSGGHSWPRWYREIPATNLQTVVMSVDLKNDASVPTWDRSVCCGIASFPESEVVNTLDGTGAFFRQAGVSAPGYGVWMLGSQTSGSNLSQVRGVASILRSSDSLGSGSYVTIKADNLAQNSGSRNSNFNQANAGVGTPQFHLVGFGTYATGAIPAGALTAMRITQSTSVLSGFGA